MRNQKKYEQEEIVLSEILRLENIDENANQRFILYEYALKRIKEKPFIGYGFNNFQYYWLKDKKPPFDKDNNHDCHK